MRAWVKSVMCGVFLEHVGEHEAGGADDGINRVHDAVLHGVVGVRHACGAVDEDGEPHFSGHAHGVGVAGDGERPLEHVHLRIGAVVEVGGEEGLLDDVRVGDGVALLLRELRDVGEPVAVRYFVMASLFGANTV